MCSCHSTTLLQGYVLLHHDGDAVHRAAFRGRLSKGGSLTLRLVLLRLPRASHRYDLLDAQLDAGKSNGAAEKAVGDEKGERKHRSSHKSHRHKDDDKDRDRKSHRSSRHRTRDEEDDRRWAVVVKYRRAPGVPPGHGAYTEVLKALAGDARY